MIQMYDTNFNYPLVHEYVKDVIESGNLTNKDGTTGKYQSKLVEYYKMMTGAQWIVPVSSGMAAWRSLLMEFKRTTNTKPSVLISSLTYPAMQDLPDHLGYDVFQYDYIEGLSNIDEGILEHPPEIIVVTHLFGRLENVLEWRTCFPESIIVEDCSHVHGFRSGELIPGMYGDYSIFSMYPTKPWGTSEGGVLCANDWNPKINPYGFIAGGYDTSRMSEISAAIACGVYESRPLVTDWIRRKELGYKYFRYMKRPEGFVDTTTLHNGFYVFPLLFEEDIYSDKNAYIDHLRNNKVPLQVMYNYHGLQALCFPTNPNMTDDDVDEIIEKVNSI